MPKEIQKKKKVNIDNKKKVTKKKEKTKASKKVDDERIHFFIRGKKVDFGMVAIIIILLTVGLVMLLSASAPYSLRTEGDSYFYFMKQLKFAIGGLILMYLMSKIDYRILNSKIAWLAYIFGLRFYGISISSWNRC